MKRLLILLAAIALAAPAAAQHQGHTMPMPAPKAKAKPAAKPAARKPAAKAAPRKPAARAPARAAPRRALAKTAPKPADKPAAKPAVDPHAGHRMAPAQPAAPATADPHAGHAMPAADPHAGHDMGAVGEAASAPPIAPPPTAAMSGPAYAADGVYGGAAMAAARAEMHDEHGDIETTKMLIDRLEVGIRNGRDGYAWDGQAWYGGDIDKAWLKTEGEGSFGEAPEAAEVQALWSHAIDPWFDLQAGVRYDFRPDPERGYLVLGVQGLAPYWFEVDAAAFVSEKGDVSARVEAEYDLRLTQKLILKPRVELDLALQDVPEIGIGSGLSTVELGARLRYEVRPEIAPYVGVEYERAFGDTAGLRRAAGEEAGGWAFLVGLRAWF